MTDPMELVGRLEAWADEIALDGTPSQVGPSSSDLTEAAACIREMVAHGERSVDYEVYQGGELVAGSDSEREIRHYAAVYEQDGPAEVFKVVSFLSPLPPAPGAEAWPLTDSNKQQTRWFYPAYAYSAYPSVSPPLPGPQTL